ncbi:hypothetical protein GOV11_03705 [Candidatus Woesearchaeota archaeon]|nr:hypothetical protein [Candidatus Woesearchaeota archaeon]
MTHTHEGRGKYLGDAVYGALDGIVTTFAIVAGVAGASLASKIVLILGIANLIADGLSMAAGNYLSKRSEEELRKRLLQDEREGVVSDPTRHENDLRTIYGGKGFSGKLLDSIVKTIMRDKERWAEEMLPECSNGDRISPVKAGAVTLAAFVIVGSVPLLSYVLAIAFPALASSSFMVAALLTAVTLFVVGGSRALLTAQRWWRAGLEMLIVGGIAAGAAYAIGAFLSAII